MLFFLCFHYPGASLAVCDIEKRRQTPSRNVCLGGGPLCLGLHRHMVARNAIFGLTGTILLHATRLQQECLRRTILYPTSASTSIVNATVIDSTDIVRILSAIENSHHYVYHCRYHYHGCCHRHYYVYHRWVSLIAMTIR